MQRHTAVGVYLFYYFDVCERVVAKNKLRQCASISESVDAGVQTCFFGYTHAEPLCVQCMSSL